MVADVQGDSRDSRDTSAGDGLASDGDAAWNSEQVRFSWAHATNETIKYYKIDLKNSAL